MEENITLSQGELQFILDFMFAGRWTGPEWHQTVTPLLEKLAQMIERMANENSTG